MPSTPSKRSRNPVKDSNRSGAQAARRKSELAPPAPPALGLVVGMGASAGGLEAFQKFFARMSPEAGMSFIVVQHLDPRHETLMPELLGKTTRMKVEQVKDETPVEADRVYVIPPNALLTIEGGVLRVTPPEAEGLRMPIDKLFHSLAEDQGHRAVCILLSGSGSDGTLGLRSVKEHGGMVMAQSPESAKHDAILRSAIATGLVDHVLLPEEMPGRLVEYAAYLRELRERNERGGLVTDEGEQVSQICALLQRRTGHDFSRYKTGTLIRRIERRMQVLQMPSFAAYLERLRKDAREADQLFRDLLISVTQFFRDPAAFETLAQEAIPALFEHAGENGSLRVWTPGCATGEEAYSIAILMREEMGRRGVRPRVQIFAGDIDDDALEFARAARYPEGIAEHVSSERLQRFFVKEDHGYQVAKEVRELCVFSTHNVIKDPPFSRLDLVVCRNLLIYLEADLQRHVVMRFHYALRTGGYLFLGPSENVVGPPELFRAVDKKHRLFQRAETAIVRAPDVLGPRTALPASDRHWTARAEKQQLSVVSTLERLLLDEYAPAWVIVNSRNEAVYYSPRTGKYLEHAPGAPSLDILSMCRKGLRLDLRSALHKALKTGEVVTRDNIEVQTNGDLQTINLVVRPLAEVGDDSGLLLVVFQELAPARSRAQARREGGAPRAGDDIVQQLESELRSTKDHLRSTIEELETSNEELKSSNEELLSTNEELQSSNEELQTSKEELQSANEELETINAELSKKIEELDAVNSDMHNLLQSTQIPTLFLDNELRIKRFTEAATAVFRLIGGDLGRPITDLAPLLAWDPVPDLRQVLRTLAPTERQVTLADGSATYLVRVLPYRRGNLIDGLVLTFLDLTRLNRALEQQSRLAAIVESSQDAIVSRTFDGVITSWNEAAARIFGHTEREAIGSDISRILPSDGLAEMERVHERLRRGETVSPYESVRRTRDGRELIVSIAVSPVKDAAGRVIGSSAIFRDITELKRAQESLRREAHQKDQFLAMLSHELRNPLAPLRTSLEILRSQPADPALVQRSLGIMERQLSQLTTLVDQLLDAARISSGKILLSPELLDLTALAREVVEDHQRQFQDARLAVELSLPERPLLAKADRARLTQALGNLLGNATKFSREGGRVGVTLWPEPSGQAVITISDTGIGIDAATRAHLFEPFVQAPGSEQSSGGLGLGLWLVKGLMEAHGGSVDVRSEGTGHGTQVILRLPMRATQDSRQDQKSPGPVERQPSTPRKILIVEDNADAADSLQRLLELQGHRVQTAGTGPAAIALARTFQPDVVLCDLQLRGDLDGFAVAAALRKAPNGSPYLVALTGYGQPEDRLRTREAGFDWHMIKPPKHDELTRLLAELPRGQRS